MIHPHTKKYSRLVAILAIFCILWQNASYVQANDGNLTQTVLITQNGTVTEYEAEPVQIQYMDETHNCTVPPVKVNDIWMVPAKNILSDILGCYYKFNEEQQTISVKTPGRESSIKYSVNSNIMEMNNQQLTMPIEVLTGTQKATDNSDFMIPLEFTLKQLGYTYFIQDISTADGTIRHMIQIQSNYLFQQAEDNISIDTEKYENALTAISILKNNSGAKNFVQAITLNPVTAENILISQNAEEYSVTITFLKTYNPFGKLTKEINNDIIQKIEVWEDEDFSSSIKIYYQQKYVYSHEITENGCTITLSKGSFSIKVILPEKVNFSKITTTDQYWKNRFLITIPGNYVSFYKTNAPYINSTNVTGITVSKTADGNTKLIVNTKGLKGYKLTAGDGFFTVKVGAPQNIYDNIVLLDAGHGGKDNGASKKGLVEKKICLSIIYTYAKEYFERPDSPVKAYWTRHDDTFINLYTRPALSKTYHADMFVSLHMNSASNTSANGTEVYYSKANNSKAFSNLTSKKLAGNMLDTLVDSLGSKDRGVKQAGFVVAKYNTVPAVLVELGFITGNTDSKKLKKASYQKKAAKALYQGIVDTFEEYPTER